MYQQIQAEKALEINKMWRWIVRNFNEFQTVLSDMNMQSQFNKLSVFEFQTISENIHKP
jgi:hypothetical protein